MPVSSNAGKAFIQSLNLKGERILDIGAGSGTYRKLFPNLGTHWTAVEIWEPYVETYGLNSLYDEVVVSDARTLVFSDRYDVAFVGDVLEHMTTQEAADLLDRLRAVCSTVVVSVPIGHCPQGECEGNPHEAHVVDNYSTESVIAAFGKPDTYKVDGWIGVFVYSQTPMIPNNIHMMWFVNDKSRPFSFINYLAVRAAKEVHNPDNLFVYYNADLPDNPHWQAAKQYATFVQVEAPTEFEGVALSFPQYQADVFRLQRLYAEGGIYLDTDAITTKPFTDLLHNHCVLGVDHKNEVIPNGMILARPGHPFLKRWLDTLASELNNPVWATHAVVLPYRLYREDPTQIDEYHVDLFLPFGWEDKGILGTDLSYADRVRDAYCVHMWESMWPEVAAIDSRYLRGDTVFARLFRKYAGLKIAVYAISKNEEMFVERFCEAAKDADLISISDTGSTDNTVALARKCGAVVHDICITPWRFDKARDTALALLPRDIDVCISLDLDEVLQPGWREEIERAWQADTTRLSYKFDWGCGIVFYYEKIHARHGYHWHHPCHEYPRADGRITEVWARTDMLLAVHKPDPTKSRGQYLDLLELSVKEDPHCPRNAFYYARELTFYNKWVDAIVALLRYLDLPGATWPNERCYAMRLLGQSYDKLGQPGTAMEWYRKASVEAPNTREPWVEMADLAYRQGDWSTCYVAAMRALEIKDKALVYTMDPSVWGAKPHDFAAIAAYHLGVYDVAITQGELACQLDPDDLRLRGNLSFYRAKLEA